MISRGDRDMIHSMDIPPTNERYRCVHEKIIPGKRLQRVGSYLGALYLPEGFGKGG